MIARTWSGAVRAEDADAYAEYLEATGMRDFRQTPGNLGAYAFRRREGDRVVFTTLSLWDGMEGVRLFAGPDPEQAVFYPEDERYLVDREMVVRHHEVTFADV